MSEALILTGRTLRLSRRQPDAVLTAMILPVLLMLVFVYFFGGAIDTGAGYTRDQYVMYVTPGVLLLCAGFGSATTAVTVVEDMKQGVIDRFRSLDIGGTPILASHVLASTARNLASTVLVLGAALLIGFRPGATVAGWLAAAGVLLAYIVAISWLSAAFGLLARSPETAGGFTFLMMFLPYPSSAFVPTETMPGWLRPFAEHQPISPVIETVRGLLLDRPVGSAPWHALAWCGGILAFAIVAAAVLFRNRTSW
ncbi:ABC transporter permease [Actinomadura fulvescens]|uniref:Transport permease protein n=1 Tax=Actinomadura fulvescens TaxID=46160 RepID=A0ABN3PKK3_9ACTN